MKNRSRGGAIESTVDCEELASLLNHKMKNRLGGQNQRLAIMLGLLTKNQEIKADIPSVDRSNYSQERFKFMLNCPWEVSNICCKVMKKNPAHSYYRQTKRTPITAEMAEESRLRTQKWLEHGCNGFDMKIPKSTPMAFWTEQDVLKYIKTYNLPICSVYGDIIEDLSGSDQVEGQYTMSDCFGEEAADFNAKNLPLKTSGCSRTGCMFCGFGCHLEKEGEGRFERMKETHPKQYEWIMKDWDEGGLGYKELIDWINENGNLNIRY